MSNKTIFIDNHQLFTTENGAPKKVMYRDAFHPSDIGTAKLACNIKHSIKRHNVARNLEHQPGAQGNYLEMTTSVDNRQKPQGPSARNGLTEDNSGRRLVGNASNCSIEMNTPRPQEFAINSDPVTSGQQLRSAERDSPEPRATGRPQDHMQSPCPPAANSPVISQHELPSHVERPFSPRIQHPFYSPMYQRARQIRAPMNIPPGAPFSPYFPPFFYPPNPYPFHPWNGFPHPTA